MKIVYDKTSSELVWVSLDHAERLISSENQNLTKKDIYLIIQNKMTSDLIKNKLRYAVPCRIEE